MSPTTRHSPQSTIHSPRAVTWPSSPQSSKKQWPLKCLVAIATDQWLAYPKAMALRYGGVFCLLEPQGWVQLYWAQEKPLPIVRTLAHAEEIQQKERLLWGK